MEDCDISDLRCVIINEPRTLLNTVIGVKLRLKSIGTVWNLPCQLF